MEKRRLGKTHIEVSAIGLGTWPIGGARYGSSDDDDARRTIEAAFEAGITCFDTAPSYGNGHAEDLLGRVLEQHRAEVVLVTKGGLIWNDRSEVLGQNGSREYLASRLDESLRRLRTHHVDLFLIHWPDEQTPVEETAAALRGLIEAGKTRHVGVSNYTGEDLRELASALGDVPLTVNQVSYHLFDQRWAESSFQVCRELGISVMAYGSLAHGLLAGAFTRATTFDATDWRASGVIFGQPLLTPENRDRNLAVVDRLAAIAREAGMTLPCLALAWVLSEPVVAVSLVGARTPAEIEESARAAALSLDAATLRAIENAMLGAVGLVSELPA